MDYTEKLNDFFKKSLNMIDNQDLEREFNKTQIKYGTDLIKKDLDIQDLDAQINTIKRKTNTLNNIYTILVVNNNRTHIKLMYGSKQSSLGKVKKANRIPICCSF